MRRLRVFTLVILILILALWGIIRLLGPQEAEVVVYWASVDGQWLVPVSMTLPDADPQTLVAVLMAGPEESELMATFPPGTAAPAVRLEDGLAYVDFKADLLKTSLGGSTGELLAVYSLVNTLTQLPQVAAVQILVEGEVVDSLFGHVDVSSPLVADPSLVLGYEVENDEPY